MVKFAAVFTALLATVASAAVVAPAPANSNGTEIAKRDVYGDGERNSWMFRCPKLKKNLHF